jgi:isopenicillin-N N-acyltransferase like protein
MLQSRPTRFILSLAATLLITASAWSAEPFRFPVGTHGPTAELKYVKDVPVLIVAGTPEEMGEAVGTLALKPAPKALGYPRDLLKRVAMERLWNVFVTGGEGMFKHFPADYQKELEALIKASGAGRDGVIVGNTLFDLKKVVACSAVLIEADRSATGGPLFGRNLDYPSLGYIHEYSLVTVYRPKGKHAFASIGFPGLVGCLSGMNDAGLCLGVLEVFDVKQGEKKFNADGVPYALCYRKILEECTTIAEAKKLLEGMQRTTTTNLAIADRDGVAVFEVAPDRVVQRTPEEGACVCTNHFCSDPLRPARPLNMGRSFERFRTLEEVRGWKEKASPDDLRKQLDAVSMPGQTLQTMVFEPAALRLHVGIGTCPSSSKPLKVLDLKPLFKGNEAAKAD